MMNKTILSTVTLALCTLFNLQAQTITVGQKFWDGYTRYEASEITADGTVIFAGQTSETQKGIADAVDVLRLKKTAQSGKYTLVQNSSLPSPFRCQWGAEVQYIRQNGMNFLAVKNSKGQTVETLVLTPDNIESLYAQQRQMEQDLLSDFDGMCDAMLMNTHMLMALDYEVVRAGAMRLAKVKNPDIVTRTNAQMLQTELDFRDGKAEGGYDNPDGLGGDGRGAEEIAGNEAEPLDISIIPSTAQRVDGFFQYAVYVNEDRPSANEGEQEAIYSVWLADERTGTAQKVCTTNPAADAQWDRMKNSDSDAVDVSITQIATAERAWLAPGDVGKVIVEGCPDGRNYWTYIIDVDAQTAKQFPSTEGVQDRDWNEKTITLASYGYDDDGRYSYRRVYSVDGKFIRRIEGKERY